MPMEQASYMHAQITTCKQPANPVSAQPPGGMDGFIHSEPSTSHHLWQATAAA
jgi:hypothetical protein